MKKSNQKPLRGAAAFEDYYRSLFEDRWDSLKASLLEQPQPEAFSAGGEKNYYLDRASIFAASALPSLDEGSCLDMCAAPGGKTLVLASRMDHDVSITANELSRSRRQRLLKVLDGHLPPENRKRITVTGYDAAVMPRFEKNAYERILLDAPCSSERHVLRDEKYLALWSPSRIRSLARRQWALLSAAFLLLKNGGFLVYATCALADAENDKAIKKLVKKYGKAVKIHPHKPPAISCEKTEFGCRFFPDVCGGSGPLYFSLIEKCTAEAKPED